MQKNRFSQHELATWSGGCWTIDDNIQIANISINTRTIQRNEAYLAIKGETFDGNSFIDQAIKKGASAIITDNKAYTDSLNIPTLIVEDSKIALGNIAKNYIRKLDIPIIGVTGSSGKTTVKEMVAAIFKTTYNTCYTHGNLNNDIGLPLSILQLDEHSQFGIFEIGSNHPGEIEYLTSILQPNVSIITNSGNAHIGNFKSEQAIADEKGEILKTLPENGTAILNKDNKFFEYHKSLCKCNVISVSIDNDADITLQEVNNNNIKIKLPNNETFEYVLPIPGKHNITNSMQAIAAAIAYNIKPVDICSALKSFAPTGMRWQTEKKLGIEFINDAYNANPQSMKATIETFATQYKQEESCLILGGMLELGETAQQEHIQLGEYISQFNWKKVIIVGQYAKDIETGLMRKNFSKHKTLVCDKNQQAITAIKSGYIQDCKQAFLKASRGFKLEEILNNI
jgi:UDP-N-acetylmuramoyl-tripeptide--D-alanyl-D-alanine ligase